MAPTGLTDESSRQDSWEDDLQGNSRPQRDVSVNGKTTEKTTSLSNRYRSVASIPDRILLRLNGLLAPAADLSAVLSTFSYVLGILAFFHIKARNRWHALHHHHHHSPNAHHDEHHDPHLKHNQEHHHDSFLGSHFDHHLDHHLEHQNGHPELVHKFHPHTSSVGHAASLLWRARLTLRLFGLLPIYARARQLIRGRGKRDQNQDQILFATELLQCGLYGISQLLENVAFLTDSHILSKRLTSRWTKAHGGGTKGIYTLAYRAWFLGVSCEFVRVFRNVQLLSQKGDRAAAPEEERKLKTGDKWWHPQLLVQLLWFPIGWQISSWTEDGFPGFNTTLHNAASVLSDTEKTGSLWMSTEKVE